MNILATEHLYFFYNNPKKKAAWIMKGESGGEYFLERYPSMEFYLADKSNPNLELYLLFQNKRYKKQFIKEINKIRENEKKNGSINYSERHMLLGNYLGFPPKAVEYFSYNKYRTVDGQPVNVGICFHGLTFSSYPETYEEDVQWLINTYGMSYENKRKVLYEIENIERVV